MSDINRPKPDKHRGCQGNVNLVSTQSGFKTDEEREETRGETQGGEEGSKVKVKRRTVNL